MSDRKGKIAKRMKLKMRFFYVLSYFMYSRNVYKICKTLKTKFWFIYKSVVLYLNIYFLLWEISLSCDFVQRLTKMSLNNYPRICIECDFDTFISRLFLSIHSPILILRIHTYAHKYIHTSKHPNIHTHTLIHIYFTTVYTYRNKTRPHRAFPETDHTGWVGRYFTVELCGILYS